MHYIFGIYSLNLTELILKPVLMYLNIFSYWRYLKKQIWKVNATQYTSINAHSYKVVMFIQKLHHFRNTLHLMMAQGWAESIWEIT